MKCENCGEKNPKNAKICKKCGQDLVVSPSDDVTIITDSGKFLLNDFIINNRFKIIRRLGKGGMGQIFLAEDVKLKRKVAIKSISTSNLSDPASKARFLREAQTASQLEHTNICTIYEIYEEDESDYIVMQYIDGVTLDHIIKLKKLSLKKIIDIALQTCDGMIEAHTKGIIHRDIKPANIMVDNKGTVKILDFGLAKFKDKSFVKEDGMVDSNLTEKGIVLGTVAYMSPEQARGKTLDQSTDIFSFGVVLYEMLAGKNPFQDKEQIVTLYNVLNKEVEFSTEIPQPLQQIVLKLLQKDKKSRFQSFAELKQAIEDVRSLATQTAIEKNGNGHTEILDSSEQQQMLKQMQRTSDNEELGEIVDRIKKLKAYTQPLFSTKRKVMKFVFIPIISILVLLAALYWGFVKQGEGTPDIKIGEDFYVYLEDFVNKTGEKWLSPMVDFLLNESLNQFPEFKVINRESALPLASNKNNQVNLKELSGRFNVLYTLTGTISKIKGRYNIEAKLSPLDRRYQSFSISNAGDKNKNGILIHQIDTVSKDVHDKFFSQKGTEDFKIKKISNIYGSDWNQYGLFYSGNNFFKTFDNDPAEKKLEQCVDLPISKITLTDLYIFNGDRKKALHLNNQVFNNIDDLTKPLELKVRAQRCRLQFNFSEEIRYLEERKALQPFLKEAYYELGEAFFHHGNASHAIKQYQDAIKLDQDYSKAINHLGYCYSHLGDHGQAITAFERYKDLDKSANSYDSLGDGRFYKGEYKAAENNKNLAVEINAKSVPWSYLTLADIYTIKASSVDAMRALDQYTQLKKDEESMARVLSRKAYIQLYNQQPQEAFKTITESMATFDSSDINNNTAEAHWLRGLISLANKQLQECKKESMWLQTFSKQYKLSADNFSAPYKYDLHLQALILEAENQASEAGQKWQKLLEMKTQLSYQITYFHYQFFHCEYAAFLIRQGDPEQAQKELDECLAFNENYIPALWLKAEILEKKDDPGTAEIYQKLLELYDLSDQLDNARGNYWHQLLLQKLSSLKSQKETKKQ